MLSEKKTYVYSRNYVHFYFRDEKLHSALKKKFKFSFRYLKRVFIYCYDTKKPQDST